MHAFGAAILALASPIALATSPAGAAESQRTTFLLSRALDGGFPDGPSRNPAVSHDQRFGRVMAYESDATNLVAGDANGMTDVFMARRVSPMGSSGTPWFGGRTELVSTGIDGAPANGRSYEPAVDGDSHHVPTCVAFISEASNLVRGDTNGVADAFIRDLRSGRITRVSVNSAGDEANGPTFDVSVDGGCERVAFSSSATNLALSRTRNRAWLSARTAGVRRPSSQVYVRVLRGDGLDRGFAGLTFLASAASSGAPANGDSAEASFARSGKAIVFTSRATNLDRGDTDPGADVYERTFLRRYVHLGHGAGVQQLEIDTRLVSARPDGRAGNGPSTHPTVTDDGRYVAYETLASDLLPGDSGDYADVARADLSGTRVKQVLVSRSRFSGHGNAASQHPVISDAGEFVLFDSLATNLKPSESVRDDANGVRDVFLWNAPTGNVSLESRDSTNGYLHQNSWGPATSSRGNYVPFVSNDLLADENLPGDALSGLLGGRITMDAALTPAPEDQPPAFPMIYLRYLGQQ